MFLDFIVEKLYVTAVYKIRWKRSDQNTQLCLGSVVTAGFSQRNNMRKIPSSTESNIITLHKFNINVTISPGDPDHLLPGLIVADDGLQVAWQSVDDGLDVTL